MEPPVLSYSDQFPAGEAIASHLEQDVALWKAFFEGGGRH